MNFNSIDLKLTEDEKSALLLLFTFMNHTIENARIALENRNSLTIGESNKFEDEMKKWLKEFVETLESR